MPSASAYYLYSAENGTDALGNRTLFAMDFSDEPLGEFEIGHKENYGIVNRSVDVINVGGDRGKCLRLNVTGVSTGGTYVGGWHTGHELTTGIVYLDYKLNLQAYGGGSDGYIGFGVGDGRTYYTGTMISFAKFASYNVYLQDYNGQAIYYKDDSLKAQWVDVHTIIDLDNDVSTLQINGVTVATGTTTVQTLTHFFVQIYSLADDRFYRQLLIDDIHLYTQDHVVSLSGDLDDPRTSLSFTFDDVPDSVYDNVFPKMRAANMAASIAVVPTWVGVANRTTWEELEEMYQSGWELMGHSYTHADHALMTPEQLAYEMDMTIAAILDNTSVDTVHGYIFPWNSYSNLALSMGWERFDYLGAPGYDLNRIWLTSIGTEQMDNYKLTSLILCSKYSYGGHLELYTHHVYNGATGSNIDLSAWNYLIDRLIAYDAKVITNHDAIMTRNANAATVTGNATAFAISYPSDVGNFRDGRVYATVVGNYTGETYVAVKDGQIIQRGAPIGDQWTILVDAGEYQVLTEKAYRDQQVDRAISPLYTVIPVVIVLAVLGGLLTMLGRLKF